jgi:Mannosyl-glycoprotein endo-beta-N-acetylglucosaminidase
MLKIKSNLKTIALGMYAYVYSLSMMLPVFVLPVVISNGVMATDTASSTVISVDARAVKIDAYFAKNDLPLTGYGYAFVETADKYDLDYRLLPAIAMRESTGGKFACPNDEHNVFGWASCKRTFESYENSIDSVGAHLSGNIKSTAGYYKTKSIPAKLKRYNSVIPAYTNEIYSIMNKIEGMNTLSLNIK